MLVKEVFRHLTKYKWNLVAKQQRLHYFFRSYIFLEMETLESQNRPKDLCVFRDASIDLPIVVLQKHDPVKMYIFTDIYTRWNRIKQLWRQNMTPIFFPNESMERMIKWQHFTGGN